MAIVIAGIIGGVVVGVIGGATSHEDHSDYDDWHDYSDYAERERRRKQRQLEEERKRKRAAIQVARSELSGIIRKNVQSFTASEGVPVQRLVTSSECDFDSFEEDMQPMDDSAKSSINSNVGIDLDNALKIEKNKLKELNSLIATLNEKILTTKK